MGYTARCYSVNFSWGYPGRSRPVVQHVTSLSPLLAGSAAPGGGRYRPRTIASTAAAWCVERPRLEAVVAPEAGLLELRDAPGGVVDQPPAPAVLDLEKPDGVRA